MRTANKALGILLVLAGLVLNPILLSKLFSNDGNISSIPVLFGIFGFEALIVLFGITVWKNKKEGLTKAALFFLSTCFTLALSVGFDRLYGAYLMPETSDILFPAFSVAKHKTSEFDLTVRINNLGFRGEKTSIEKKKKRVLLIGDSFTFGWGVELEKTWVHLLAESYPEIEFMNLGQGGNHPGDYVRVAKMALPMLKPDLVIIGILQGNDLHQLMRVIEFEESGKSIEETSQTCESNKEKLQRYLSVAFPNLSKRFPSTTSIQGRWKLDAQKLLGELSTNEKDKYMTLVPELRSDFESGLLNPSLIDESLHHPCMLIESVDTSNALCKRGIIRLHDHLWELETLASENGVDFLFLSLPNRPYGFPDTKNALSELGFETESADTLDANLPLKLAMQGLRTDLLFPSISLGSQPLFFHYDGHWNENGNRIFAAELISGLEQNKTWKHFLTSSDF